MSVRTHLDRLLALVGEGDAPHQRGELLVGRGEVEDVGADAGGLHRSEERDRDRGREEAEQQREAAEKETHRQREGGMSAPNRSPRSRVS